MRQTSDRQSYTKDVFRKVIELWESTNLNDLAEQLSLKPQQVNYLAKQIRDAGYKLPKKRIYGRTKVLVTELLQEMKLIRS